MVVGRTYTTTKISSLLPFFRPYHGMYIKIYVIIAENKCVQTDAKRKKPAPTIHMDVCHYHKLKEIYVLLCMCYLTKEWRKHNFLNYVDEDIIIDINYQKEGESSFFSLISSLQPFYFPRIWYFLTLTHYFEAGFFESVRNPFHIFHRK